MDLSRLEKRRKSDIFFSLEKDLITFRDYFFLLRKMIILDASRTKQHKFEKIINKKMREMKTGRFEFVTICTTFREKFYLTLHRINFVFSLVYSLSDASYNFGARVQHFIYTQKESFVLFWPKENALIDAK